MPDPTVSRRSFFAAAGGGAALLLAGCGSDASTGRAGSSGGPAWRYTDDRGRQVSLPKVPERVVAQVTAAAALWDFGVRVVGVFGPSTQGDGSKAPLVGNVDLDQVESVGKVWNEFNIEKYAALRPHLLVSVMYVGEELWYVPQKSTEEIERIAPTIGIRLYDRPLPKSIERFADLAGRLGADLDAPSVTDAKARFEAASEQMQKIAKDKPGLTVLGVSGQTDAFYAANPAKHPTLGYLVDLGFDVVVPDNPGSTNYYENLSWENADTYPADVILWDARPGSLAPKQMADKPTWRRLPAVRAGQLIPWHSESQISYLGYAEFLEELIAKLRDCRADVV